MTEAPGMGLVLDCHDLEALAPFWAEALGYVTLGSAESYVLLVPDSRPGPKLLHQRVPKGDGPKQPHAPRFRFARH
jgi:Glyoxalase-like domain